MPARGCNNELVLDLTCAAQLVSAESQINSKYNIQCPYLMTVLKWNVTEQTPGQCHSIWHGQCPHPKYGGGGGGGGGQFPPCPPPPPHTHTHTLGLELYVCIAFGFPSNCVGQLKRLFGMIVQNNYLWQTFNSGSIDFIIIRWLFLEFWTISAGTNRREERSNE